jgi:hypothetical protein
VLVWYGVSYFSGDRDLSSISILDFGT